MNQSLLYKNSIGNSGHGNKFRVPVKKMDITLRSNSLIFEVPFIYYTTLTLIVLKNTASLLRNS